MSPVERATFVADLEKTRDAFGEAMKGVSEAQAKFKPAPEVWSLEEVAEHVALAERGMYRLITERYQASDDPREAESAATWARAKDPEQRLSAPPRVVPTGQFGGLDGSMKAFLEHRQNTIGFVGSCNDDLRLRLIQHPVGLVNGLDCLRILTFHPIRHIRQIEGIKSHSGYPQA